jgi:hypothetical protein
VVTAATAAMVVGLGAAPAAFAAPSHSSPATVQVRQKPHQHNKGEIALPTLPKVPTFPKLPKVPSAVSCGIDVAAYLLPEGYALTVVVLEVQNVKRYYGVISDVSNGKQVGEILLDLVRYKGCYDLVSQIAVWYFTDIAPKLAPLTPPPPGQPNQPGPPPTNNGQCVLQPNGQCIPFVTLGGNPPR